MRYLEDLELLVNELANNTNEEEQTKILQKIGKLLLTEYIIQVGETSSNIGVVINADETGSGLKTLEYAWSTSKITVPTQWKILL